MVDAILQELVLQRDYLKEEPISSVYFGGGTPSLLNQAEIDKLLNRISGNFLLSDNVEITLEANPDDLYKEKLLQFFKSGINRLSIGIQSFDDMQLKFLNRAHNGAEAKRSVVDSREAGFRNISIDLIFAIPDETSEKWEQNLENALLLNPEHISSYALTIEPQTVFGVRTKKGKMHPVSEETAANEFETLMNTLSRNGYEQYEISNFCRPGYYSRHNSNYWKEEKYLGVGPGAHSYNRKYTDNLMSQIIRNT